MNPHTTPTHVEFRDGTRLDVSVPTDTRDPRYIACTEHRTACDCREAHLGEDIAEYRAEYRAIRTAIREYTAAHPDGCMCGVCQVARRVHVR